MTATDRSSARTVVTGFLEHVRTGADPEAASAYMAPSVVAHQLSAEHETTVIRTPAEYAEHVREMVVDHGDFVLEILHCYAEDDHVAVMWRQTGGPQARVRALTGHPVTELASVVYRVAEGRIAEYWILIDRLGIERQVRAHR